MVNLILFVLSTIGMCHIIMDGSILQWFRDLVKKVAEKIKYPSLGGVVDCYLCCGTWCGFVMGAIWISHNPFCIFACGCAGGFLSNFAAVILNFIEVGTIYNISNQSSHHNSETKNEV
jgi:hypothetical protein